MSAIVKVANQSTIVDTFLSFVLFFPGRLEFFQDQLKSIVYIVHPLEFIRDRYQINHLSP